MQGTSVPKGPKEALRQHRGGAEGRDWSWSQRYRRRVKNIHQKKMRRVTKRHQEKMFKSKKGLSDLQNNC